MPIAQLSSRETRPAGIPQGRPTRGAALARTIVNIAGLGPGDRVLIAGRTDAAVDEAVVAAGARPVGDEDGKRWLTRRRPVDAALWDFGPAGPYRPAETLVRFRRRLVAGGRLVVWSAADSPDCASRFRDALQRLMEDAGLSSIIVGRVPAEAGEVVVATGVVGQERLKKVTMEVDHVCEGRDHRGEIHPDRSAAHG